MQGLPPPLHLQPQPLCLLMLLSKLTQLQYPPSGDTTPCRMTGVTLHSHVRCKEDRLEALCRDLVQLHLLRTVAYLRLIDSCITQLKAQGPARTCNEGKEEEED